MAEPYDRWHRANPSPGGPRCREHNLVPSASHGQGRRWQARWRDEAGRQRAGTFVRKTDAAGAGTAARADLARGSYVAPAGGKTRLAVYAEEHRAAQVHRPSTAVQVESHLRRHVYPVLGDRPLGAVRPSEVQAWVRGLERDLAPATIRVVYAHLAGIFRAAVRDRLIPASPCVGIRLPKLEPKRVTPLPTEQVEDLIAAIPARYRALVVLAAGTGLRQGECFGLEVGAVDFLRRQLEVRQQLVTVGGEAPYIGPPKTAASYRTVPLPRVVVDALAAHLAAFPAVAAEITDATVKPDPERRPAALVFTGPTGRPLRRTRFAEAWQPAATVAGLGDGVSFHDLRHYFASLLIRHGESVKVVQNRLGHASAVETLNVYSHLWPDAEDRTREAVDAVLGRAAAPGRRAVP